MTHRSFGGWIKNIADKVGNAMTNQKTKKGLSDCDIQDLSDHLLNAEIG